MTTELSRPEQENALRQILRLVDLGCDLERNASDGEHQRAGRELIYVFDENIMEMFVRPSRYHRDVETFYADVWSFQGHPRTVWRNFEAQAALVAAEYLIGLMNGAASDRVYMTEFHRWELSYRIERLYLELNESARLYDQKVADELSQKVQIIEQMMARSGLNRSYRAADQFLKRDLEELKNRVNQNMLDRFYAARIGADFFANSDIAEPLDQLMRIVSDPLRSKFKSLHYDFVPTKAKLRDIEGAAESWFASLATELTKPQHRARVRGQGNVSPRALWNDARSLAFLQWVVKERLKSNQRLVFITADPVIFDAYRRWYFSIDGNNSSPNEPFFLRRAAQYSPLFNPNQGGGDLRDAKGANSDDVTLFSQIQQAVETALLALPADDDMTRSAIPGSITSYHRESLALLQVDREELVDEPKLKPLAVKLSEGWVYASTGAIHKNRDLWQRLERFAIGTSYDLVAARIGAAQKSLSQRLAASPSSDTSKILSDYVSKVLDELVEKTIQLWIPLAASFKEGAFYDPEWRRPPIKRFSLAVDLPSPGTRMASDDIRTASNPEIIFAHAAAKAVETQDAPNAVRFAKIAMQADNASRSTANDLAGFAFELRYLNAVANRIAISATDGHLRPVGPSDTSRRLSAARAIDLVKTSFDVASRDIDVCIATHAMRSEADLEHAVRYLRALSERASLHLFIATSLGLSRVKHPPDLVADAIKYLEVAKGDLTLCFEYSKRLEPSHYLVPFIRDQFVPNLAGYEVLTCLIRKEKFKALELSLQSLRLIWQFWEDEGSLHPLLYVELMAFSRLIGRLPPRSVKKRSHSEIRNGVKSLRLPLDRHLYRTICRELLEISNSN